MFALWINTAVPWTSKAGSAPTLDDLAIMYATPRLLVCHITAQSILCDCVVLHASDLEQEAWWDNVALELSPHLRTGVPRIFFMDTNTSFASGVSGVIGEDTGGVESAHAPLAAAALENLEVAVMSTYDGYRKPEASLHSWYCNANSQWRSIVFIGTSEDISVQTGSCYAVDNFETCADNLDHRPVAQLLELRGVQRKPVTRRRCPQYSRDDVRAAIHGTDPKWLAAKLNFTVHMARCPTVSHLVEASSHRHIVVEHVVDGLVANFPANQSKKPFSETAS